MIYTGFENELRRQISHQLFREIFNIRVDLLSQVLLGDSSFRWVLEGVVQDCVIFNGIRDNLYMIWNGKKLNFMTMCNQKINEKINECITTQEAEFQRNLIEPDKRSSSSPIRDQETKM